MNPIWSTIIAAAVPTFAVIFALVRNETSSAALAARVTSLEQRTDTRATELDHRISGLQQDMNGRLATFEQHMNARFETLDRDLREWARIIMTQNTDIARLKDKTGLE